MQIGAEHFPRIAHARRVQYIAGRDNSRINFTRGFGKPERHLQREQQAHDHGDQLHRHAHPPDAPLLR